MDLVSIGFQYTGGLNPMIADAKLAGDKVAELDSAVDSLKRTELQAEKVAGRLALTLREKNNILRATAKGNEDAVIQVKQHNLQQRLLAQGIQEDSVKALLELNRQNLELEKSTKAAANEQKLADQAMRKATEQIQMQEKALADLHQEALKMNNTVDKLNGNLQAERLRIKALKEGTASARVEYKLFNIEREASKTLSGSLLKSYMQEQRALLRTEEAIKLVNQRKKGLHRTNGQVQKSMSKTSMGAGQAAIQFEQFFNQLQGGANPMLAFSQQAADLGIVLGRPMLGAIAGISGAILGLGSSLLLAETSTKKLKDQTEALDMVFNTTKDSAIEFSDEIISKFSQMRGVSNLRFAQSFKELREELKSSEKTLDAFFSKVDIFTSIESAVGGAVTQTSIGIESLAQAVENGDKKILTLAGTLEDTETVIDVFAKRLGLPEESTRKLIQAFSDFSSDKSLDTLKPVEKIFADLSISILENSKKLGENSGATADAIEKYITSQKQLLLLKSAQDEIGVSTKELTSSQQSLLDILDPLTAIERKYAEEIETVNNLNEDGRVGTLSYQEALDLVVKRRKDAIDALNKEEEVSDKYAETLEKVQNKLRSQILSLEGNTQASKELQIAQQLGLDTTKAIDSETQKLIERFIELTDKKKVDAEAQRLVNNEMKAAQKDSETYADQLEGLLNNLDPLSAATRQFEINQGILNEAWFLGKITLSEYDAALEKLNAKYKNQTDDLTGATKAQQDFAKLQEDIAAGADRLGTSFRSSGNGIANAFAEASDVLLGFGDRMRELNEQQEKLNKHKIAGINTTKEQAELDAQVLSAQLSGISSLFGATKNMFDEQSSARKKMHQAELVFQAVEIGLALQKAVANAVTAVTNQGSGDPYTAFARVAAMTALMAGTLSQIGVAFGGGGGSAPTVGPAGTGTILGDDSAQSDSISASQERFEDIQLDQLAELRGIHDGISDLSGAINVLTRNIISAGNLDGSFATGLGTSGQFDSGGFSAAVFGVLGLVTDAFTGGFVSDILDGLIGGLFGGKTTAEVQDAGIKFMTQNLSTILETGIVDAVQFANIKITEEGGLFGLLSDDVSYEQQTQALGEDFTRQLGDIIGSIADTLLLAGDTLDIAFKTFSNGATTSLEDALEFFVIPELDISFEGKTGEEIEQELNALFSSIGDDLATFLFPQLLQYQQINEGMFETVLRVTQETVVFADALDLLGSSMSTSAALDFGQSVLTAMGGLENFTDAFGNFYQEFFTEQERANNTLQSLTEVFAQLGLTVPETKEDYRELVEETAAMGIEGAETLAVLLEVSGAFADMRDTLDELAASANDGVNDLILLVDFFNGINDANNEFFSNFELTGPSFASLIEAFGSGGEVAAAVQALANNFANAGVQMDVAQEGITSSITGILAELNGINGGTATDAEAAFLALRDSMGRTSATADELDQQMLTVINSLTQADLDSGLLEQILRIQGGIDSYIESLRQQEQALESATNTLNNREMDMMIQLLELQGKSSEALALTRSRELEELQKIDEANRELGLQSNLADLQAAIFLQEDYNKALEDSKTATSAAYDALNEAVTAQVSVLTDLVNELESQRNRIQSALRQQDVTTFGGFDLAMKELQEVLAAVTDGNLSANDLERVSALDLSTLTAGDTSGFSSLAEFTLSQAKVTNSLRELDSVLESAESAEQSKIDALNAELSAAKDQRDALLGIQEATLDLTDLEAEIASKDDLFQTEAERLADLQLAELEGLLTEEEQQRLNQALEDAIGTLLTQISTLDTSGLADIFVEITQLSQAVNELPSGLTDSFNNLKSSIDLIPEKMDEIWSQKQDSMQEHVSFMETWKDSQITLLQDILNNLVQSGGSDTPVFDSLGIISEIQTLNVTLRELTSNQWNQNRNTLPRIVDATEYLRDSLINDDRRKVSLPNSHYSNQLGILSAIQDLAISPIEDLPSSTTPDYSGLIVELQRIANATEYLRDSLFNDDRRKVSLPNSHYKGLFAIQDATEYLRDSLVNDDRRKVSLPNSHYKLLTRNAEASEELVNKLNISSLQDKLTELTSNNYNQLLGIHDKLSMINDSVLSTIGNNTSSGDVVFDSSGIISQIEIVNATLRELTSNQWHQNRNTLPRIVDATEYLRDSLINDDRRKVSLPNSHYKGLFAIQDATEYLRDSLINDDRRKVSLPNSHYKLLTRNADASEYLVNSLINDDRRKVSLPNSHYNNQTEIIEELKSLRAEINDMAATQESIGRANLNANRKTSEINQRFEINGIDTNTSTT